MKAIEAFLFISLLLAAPSCSFRLTVSKWPIFKCSGILLYKDNYCRRHERLNVKKIEDEESLLNSKKNKPNRKDKVKSQTATLTDKTANAKSADVVSSNSQSNSENSVNDSASNSSNKDSLSTQSSTAEAATPSTPSNEKVQRRQVDPEIVFFGDPRQSPPIEAAQDAMYHGTLLFWARHGSFTPRDTIERRNLVLPFAFESIRSEGYRLNEKELTYDLIFKEFVKIMGNIALSKTFISTNIDLVPSALFMRALTAHKLKAQYENNLEEMAYIKSVRQQYILAHDQLFFPLNIETRKAETRVMTYLSRDEFPEFAKTWDNVETTLHFMTLVSARITWDLKVQELLDRIKRKVLETVDYMAEAVRKDLMTREFRRPGITAEVYTNATLQIEKKYPEIYRKVAPEIRIIHETYDMTNAEEIKSYVTEFCVKNGFTMDSFKMRLNIFSASLAGIQGSDYTRLRIQLNRIHDTLCSTSELESLNSWYKKQFQSGYGFSTYEPDEIPRIVNEELKYRDTGNAFLNFGVEVMKMNPIGTNAFSGKRPKASALKNWLERDPDYDANIPTSSNEKLESFKIAYSQQMSLRSGAESALNTYIDDRINKSLSVLPAVTE